MVACALVFAWLAWAVATGRTVELDLEAIMAVHSVASPGMSFFMRIWTTIGQGWVLVPLGLFVAFWAYRRGDPRAALVMLIMSATIDLLNTGIKVIFQRARPDLFEEMPRLTTYSFPSGHAMSSCAMLGLMAVVVARLRPRARPWLVALTPLVALLIGVSRSYLGMHWPADVLAGWVAGGFFLAGAVLLLRPRPAQGSYTASR